MPTVGSQLIMSEVKNTFGETQNYWLSASCETGGSQTARSYNFAKTFHVSPFISMNCSYHWTFTTPGESLLVQTNVDENHEAVFDGTLKLVRRPWSAQWLRHALTRFPWVTAKTIAAIHLEAVRLYLKKRSHRPSSGAWTLHPCQYAPCRRILEHRMKHALPKRLFLQLLGSLKEGFLELVCPEDTYSFGSPDSDLRAMLVVHHERFFRRALFGGDIGMGEAFMDGDWSSPDLVAVIRLAVRNLGAMENSNKLFSALSSLADTVSHRLRGNTLAGSRRNISYHYDFGNDFYRLFLDPTHGLLLRVFSDSERQLWSRRS